MPRNTKRERPVDLLSLDAQATHMLRSADAAGRCVARLVREGFTVLRAELGNRNPRVIIERSPRCARLHGAMAIRLNTGDGPKQIMVAEVESCQVQWTEEAA